jgi:hypothetical protein
MFDLKEHGESIRVYLIFGGLWLAQIVIAAVVYFVVIGAIGNALEGHPYSPEVRHPAARLGMPPISLGGGYLLGRLVPRYFASFRSAGRWVWVPITVFFLWLFLKTLPGGILVSFISAFDVEGKEALAAWILSLPMLFYLGYSLACWIPKGERGPTHFDERC